MISLVPDIPYIIWKKFREKETIDFLRSLELDYILSIHFPYIIFKGTLRAIIRDAGLILKEFLNL